MAEITKIAWTDHTFNPWMGCVKVSAGCANCYAEVLTKNRMGLRLWGTDAARKKTKAPWEHVRQWQRAAASGVPGQLGPGRHLVFCGSLMDWAEKRDDLDPLRQSLWDVIRSSPNLTFQMLTKRPENIQRYLPNDWGEGYANVWLGTSIEDMRGSDRADALRTISATVRFISYEPALGPLDAINLEGIDWVIQGGESGPGFRPMPIEWARAMRDHCQNHGVAYYFKQSAAIRTEMGIHLDGEIVRNFPKERTPILVAK